MVTLPSPLPLTVEPGGRIRTTPSFVTLTVEPGGKGYTDLVPLTKTAMLPLSGGVTTTLSPCVFVAVVVPSFVVTVVVVPFFVVVVVLVVCVTVICGLAGGAGDSGALLLSGTSIQA